MKVMYIDESGDHGLKTVDPRYPVFVLGGVIVDRTYVRTDIRSRVQQLKRDFFGRDDIVLHTADIVRGRNGFERLAEPGFRTEFYTALNVMMDELEYTVAAGAIKKASYIAAYGVAAPDPYRSSVGDRPDGGSICAEMRNPRLDYELAQAWERLKVAGTERVAATAIDERIVDLSLKDKRLNDAGLQLADLVVSPIGRAVIGKATDQDWEIVRRKLRREAGSDHGADLVVRPS